MVERIAPRPMHHTDIRIGQALAIIVEFRPWIQQHVGNARHGNKAFDRIAARRHRRPTQLRVRITIAMFTRQTNGDTAPRQADLTQHRRQDDAHPIGLLPMIRAL